MITDKLKIRFFSKIVKTDSCWIWKGTKTSKGYGKFRVRLADDPNKTVFAHRLSWILHNGDIPSGLVVCHRCDNPLCVNPEHLFTGTQKDNTEDMVSKDRSSFAFTGTKVQKVATSKARIANLGSYWITDGVSNNKIKKETEIPPGWYKGRTIK